MKWVPLLAKHNMFSSARSKVLYCAIVPRMSLTNCTNAGNTLHICPAVGSTARLVVTWQWRRHPLKQKTAEYAAALLGGQAQGSLRAALRRRGWATAVEAYCEGDGFSDNDSYTLFQVCTRYLPSILCSMLSVASSLTCYLYV